MIFSRFFSIVVFIFLSLNIKKISRAIARFFDRETVKEAKKDAALLAEYKEAEKQNTSAKLDQLEILKRKYND